MTHSLQVQIRARVLEACSKANDDVSRGLGDCETAPNATSFYTDRMWKLGEQLTKLYQDIVPQVIQAGSRGVDGWNRYTLPGQLSSLLYSVLKGVSLQEISPGWQSPEGFLKNMPWPGTDHEQHNALCAQWHNSHKQIVASMKAKLTAAIESESETYEVAFEKAINDALRTADLDPLHHDETKRKLSNRISGALATRASWMVSELHRVVELASASHDSGFMARYLLFRVLYRRAKESTAPHWERDEALLALVELLQTFEDLRKYAQTCLDSRNWGVSWKAQTEEGVESGNDFSRDNPFYLLKDAISANWYNPNVQSEANRFLRGIPHGQNPNSSDTGSQLSTRALRGPTDTGLGRQATLIVVAAEKRGQLQDLITSGLVSRPAKLASWDELNERGPELLSESRTVIHFPFYAPVFRQDDAEHVLAPSLAGALDEHSSGPTNHVIILPTDRYRITQPNLEDLGPGGTDPWSGDPRRCLAKLTGNTKRLISILCKANGVDWPPISLPQSTIGYEGRPYIRHLLTRWCKKHVPRHKIVLDAGLRPESLVLFENLGLPHVVRFSSGKGATVLVPFDSDNPDAEDVELLIQVAQAIGETSKQVASHFPLADLINDWPTIEFERPEFGDDSFGDLISKFKKTKEHVSKLQSIDSREALRDHLKGVERSLDDLRGVLHIIESWDKKSAIESRDAIRSDFDAAAMNVFEDVRDAIGFVEKSGPADAPTAKKATGVHGPVLPEPAHEELPQPHSPLQLALFETTKAKLSRQALVRTEEVAKKAGSLQERGVSMSSIAVEAFLTLDIQLVETVGKYSANTSIELLNRIDDKSKSDWEYALLLANKAIDCQETPR